MMTQLDLPLPPAPARETFRVEPTPDDVEDFDLTDWREWQADLAADEALDRYVDENGGY
jgi:hypothetical protein